MKQTVSEKGINIIVALGVSLIVILLFDFVFKLAMGEMSPLPKFYKDIPTLQHIFSGLILAPTFEEIVFRKVPIDLLKNTQMFKESKWLIVVIIGIIFGWTHGSYFNVYCQGVVGVAFGWVYIKNEYSYLSSVITHSLYNFLVMIVIPIVVY